MIYLVKLRRWTVRALGVLVLVSAIIHGGAAYAQNPTSAQLPKMTYTKNTIFHLPVQMEDRTRANLREVCLYVKSSSSEWTRQESGGPNTTHFSYKVPRDGEYWFSLVTIDKAGRMTPSDVAQEGPGLRVMVDTQSPVIDVQPWTSPEGEFCLKCQVLDANPDQASIRASYRDQTGEHVVEAMPGNPNIIKIVGRDLLNQPLHISGADLCGNNAGRDVNVRDMVVAALQATKNAGSKVIQASAQQDGPPPLPMLPVEVVRTDVQKPAFPPVPMLPETSPVNPPAINTQGANQAPNNLLPVPPPSVPSMPTPPQTSVFNRDIVLAKASGSLNINGSPRQILNTTHATVDYRIDQVGPSGVGKVEVYLTGDGGMVWQRVGEDPDRRSPADIDLPGEGVFGIRLAITNGNGFGGTAPARGDAPTCWIEVDTTAPIVQLRPIDPAQNGFLELRWIATDKNLGTDPINLYYKIRPDSAWQVIARNVKNEGVYRWSFPRDQGSQFFVKVEATDLAGNTSQVESPNAILLDITEPHASVVGVTGVSARTPTPPGN